MICRVCVTKYGFANIEANSPREAILIAENELIDSDFQWSDLCYAEFLEEVEEGEE